MNKQYESSRGQVNRGDKPGITANQSDRSFERKNVTRKEMDARTKRQNLNPGTCYTDTDKDSI